MSNVVNAEQVRGLSLSFASGKEGAAQGKACDSLGRDDHSPKNAANILLPSGQRHIRTQESSISVATITPHVHLYLARVHPCLVQLRLSLAPLRLSLAPLRLSLAPLHLSLVHLNLCLAR